MILETLNYWVALGSIGMQVLAVLLLVLFFVRKDFPALSFFVTKWGVWASLLLTLVSIAMALFYSDYLGIIPCSLCWYQRIFLFPQAILFVVALWKDCQLLGNPSGSALREPPMPSETRQAVGGTKETARIADYSIVLSVFGAVVALYQHYIQIVGESPLPCPASGGDCLKRFLFEFGYVTFPLVAFSAFALLIVTMLFVRKSHAAGRN